MAGKKSSRVLNLPIIDVQEGRLLGKVRSLLVDPRGTRVVSCEVGGRAYGKGKSLRLPFAAIRRIGPDALIVDDAAALEEGLEGGAAGKATSMDDEREEERKAGIRGGVEGREAGRDKGNEAEDEDEGEAAGDYAEGGDMDEAVEDETGLHEDETFGDYTEGEGKGEAGGDETGHDREDQASGGTAGREDEDGFGAAEERLQGFRDTARQAGEKAGAEFRGRRGAGFGAAHGEGTPLIGKKAVSEGGHLLGTIKDFTFAEDGSLIDLYLTAGMGDFLLKGDRPLPAADLKSVGRDYAVIREETAQEILKETASIREPLSQIRDRGKDISRSLEVRAIEFSLGKSVNRDIYGPEGEPIIYRGEQVTSDIIDTARSLGRLPQLLVAAGVGEIIEALDVPREKLDAGSRKLLEFWERLKSRGMAERERGPEGEGPAAPLRAAEPEEEDRGGKAGGQDAAKKTDEEGELEDFLDELQSFSRSTAKKLEKTSYSAMRRYLRGRYASEQVVGPGGEVLAEGEQLIDDEVIARAEDRGLLSHLFIGVFKEEVQGRLGNLKDAFTDFFEGKR